MSSSRVRAVATIPRRPKLAFQFVTLLMALGVPNTRAQPFVVSVPSLATLSVATDW